MTTFISILRGINVSGHRLIKMDALKELCASLKMQQVKTYIQSGNIVFQSVQGDCDAISKKLEHAILKKFGFAVPVITLSQYEFKSCIEANPFLKDKKLDAAFFHVTFLSEQPSIHDSIETKAVNLKNDLFVFGERCIYLYCPDGYGNTKLTNSFFESKLKVTATTRNWKTVNELLRLAEM
ncbi:MAG TPA: DUF1697 domain-containing protein [Bacteroidia bacterium]|jgi:uncharacterized protein (DUF1697 family)|nr:DUF1697 domain-containing protein [Bacteroidia bacterium]QQR95209.1 MAG: DUF1697 domain-containing protein [Bacteroidota bacterium]MBP7715538.1 DUF1697 domain-containing protein [Bacteroidia bacterium]MBP8669376.1 DUF1697 domain-containing protein [Bacteroidia bacterium]HOZ83777.1 DUF1697 domain-containing protein [Bacteroidia bacterium]